MKFEAARAKVQELVKLQSGPLPTDLADIEGEWEVTNQTVSIVYS